MAKWKRRRSRMIPAGLNRYYSAQGHMIRPGEDDADDGATGGDEGGVGVRCDQPVAASVGVESCAPVVVEAKDAKKGTQGGEAVGG